jgi:hydrogenase nickel incorporation protein HypB
MSTAHIHIHRAVMDDSLREAMATRAWLAQRRWPMFNFIGSPGAGKTALLEALAGALAGRLKFAVIEGDCATARDAERVAARGIHAVQIVTGDGCHLPAAAVRAALADLPADGECVLVENVGNLVCPAAFDIGETAKVAVLSVTEGEDKPLKYPALFRKAGALVLTKTDLLPHLRFDLDACRRALRQVNSVAPLFEVSARSGRGLAALADWLLQQKNATSG